MTSGRAKAGRRAFLALGAGTILGGCVQSGAPGGQRTATQSESPPSTADETETTMNRPKTESTTTERGGVTIEIDSNKSEPQATKTISGTGEQDLFEDEDGITVWNDAETVRHITVAVGEKNTSGEPLFQETYRFEPDAYVLIGIETPGEYVVTVGIEGEDPKTVDFAVDDCNDQSLFIIVTESGTVRSNGISTAMACATVAVTDADGG
ncbi:MAG TPA: hypothetical protein VFJ06_09050 [Halococcus sp.]|nr:hypothetical protein [Halococcus sp.]